MVEKKKLCLSPRPSVPLRSAPPCSASIYLVHEVGTGGTRESAGRGGVGVSMIKEKKFLLPLSAPLCPVYPALSRSIQLRSILFAKRKQGEMGREGGGQRTSKKKLSTVPPRALPRPALPRSALPCPALPCLALLYLVHEVETRGDNGKYRGGGVRNSNEKGKKKFCCHSLHSPIPRYPTLPASLCLTCKVERNKRERGKYREREGGGIENSK
jgi:hypothetical protein